MKKLKPSLYKEYFHKGYKPTLNPNTMAGRIIEVLKVNGPMRYKDIFQIENHKPELHSPDAYSGLEPGYSQLVARMLAYDQIERYVEDGITYYQIPT